MKKKLILFALPAMLVLAGCNPLSSYAAAGVKADLYLEDTLAHEEIFGDVSEAGAKLLAQAPARALEKPIAPITGVQYKPLENDKYAIRYIAAIDSKATTAVWTRNICESSGNRRKTENSQVPVTKYYLTINDGGTPTTAADFAESESYERFVVYTLRNIPKSDLNSYLFAYLTVSNDAGSSQSLARISKVSGGNTFTIDTSERTGYFLQGKIGGNDNQFYPVNDPGGNDNWIQEEGIPLNANDEVGLFKYESGGGEHFQCFGYDTFRQCIPFTERVSDSNYCKVPSTGLHSLYLNKSNEVHFVVPNKSNGTLYLNPSDAWRANKAWFAIYAYGDSGNTWYGMETLNGSDTLYVAYDLDLGTYPNIIFCRMNLGGTTEWSNAKEQTADITFIPTNVYNIAPTDYWTIYA